MSQTGSWLRALIELVGPSSCPGCDLPLGGRGSIFCAACEPLLERIRDGQAAPKPGAAVYLYAGPLADAIRRLKYGGRGELAGPLGRLLAEASLPYAGRVDRVVPLPLHPERLRARGFNQSALLAREVARALGAAIDVHSLRRVRPTRDQAGLAREERIVNVRGAFRALPAVRGRRVLLIDDVRTTGATLASAGEALLEAGASQVHSLALAHARG